MKRISGGHLFLLFGLIALLLLRLSNVPFTSAQTCLPGTQPLVEEGDLAMQMVDGINTFLLRETTASIKKRDRFWKRDYRSVEFYNQSVSPNRQRLRKMIGAVDERIPQPVLELDATTLIPALVGTDRKSVV